MWMAAAGATGKWGTTPGMNVLLPFLRFHGRDSVDAIFLSHLDSDHILGAIELLYCVPVGRVYLPDCEVRDRETYPLLIKALAENNVPLYKLRAGETLDIGGDAVLECIYPTEGNIIKEQQPGLRVLRYARGEMSVLFTGDLDMGRGGGPPRHRSAGCLRRPEGRPSRFEDFHLPGIR